VSVFKLIYKDSKKYAYGSYLRDAKRGRNSSRNQTATLGCMFR